MDHSSHGLGSDYNVDHADHNQYQRHIGHVHDVETSTEITYSHNVPWSNDDGHSHQNGSADLEHNSGNGHVHSMSSMTFHFGANETVLFSWWAINGPGTMVASFFGVFLLAMFYEGLKFYRDRLLCRSYSPLPYRVVECGHHGVVNSENGGCGSVRNRPEACIDKPVGDDDLLVIQHKMFSWSHAWQTFLHALQVTISYCLMLIFMTYNLWLCFAVVLGATLGYFIFGCRKSYVVDVTEHCH